MCIRDRFNGIRTNLVRLVKSTLFGKLFHVLTTHSLKHRTNCDSTSLLVQFMCPLVPWYHNWKSLASYKATYRICIYAHCSVLASCVRWKAENAEKWTFHWWYCWTTVDVRRITIKTFHYLAYYSSRCHGIRVETAVLRATSCRVIISRSQSNRSRQNVGVTIRQHVVIQA